MYLEPKPNVVRLLFTHGNVVLLELDSEFVSVGVVISVKIERISKWVAFRSDSGNNTSVT